MHRKIKTRALLMMKHIAYPGFGNDEGTNQEVLINYLLRGIKRNISNWPV